MPVGLCMCNSSCMMHGTVHCMLALARLDSRRGCRKTPVCWEPQGVGAGSMRGLKLGTAFIHGTGSCQLHGARSSVMLKQRLHPEFRVIQLLLLQRLNMPVLWIVRIS